MNHNKKQHTTNKSDNKAEGIRQWLEKNKIFLDVVSAMLLPVAAVYVAYKANSIADVQTKIMEQQVMPRIEIRTDQIFNEKNELSDTQMFSVFNMGGKLSNFDYDHVEFLNIELYNGISSNDTILLPIADYQVVGGIISGNSEGLVYTLTNSHGDSSIVNLRNNLITKHIGYCNILSYAKVTYEDLFGNEHKEYFRTNPDVVKIKEIEWNKVKNDFRDPVNKQYYLRKNGTSTADILKMLNDKNSINGPYIKKQ